MNILRISRTYKSARRLQQIVNVFLRHGFGSIIDQIHLGRYIPFFKRIRAFGHWPPLKSPTVPERLRIAFAELGPAFIKLAQILSTRPDLITSAYADEFRKLQDEVPAFGIDEARAILEHELGRPVLEIFDEMDDMPIAAASIAQVHRARLKNGQVVVVKIQRPNIEDLIKTDISILETISRLLIKHVPESKFFNPEGIVQEFRKTVLRELDFRCEARNCMRFRKNFSGFDDVYFPEPYNDLITGKVLVMERLDGVRIDDIAAIESMGLDRKRLARIGVDAYLKMIFDDGFFHADPHPGNIFALPSGKVGFADFGIVGSVTDVMKQAMAGTFAALITKDYDSLIDRYIELGLVPEDKDQQDFREEFKADLIYVLEPMFGLQLKEINISKYLEIIVHLALKHSLRFPSELMLINKAMLILEDAGRRLDPDFDFMEVAEPYAKKLLKQTASPLKFAAELANDAKEAAEFALAFPKQMKKIISKALKDDLHLKMTLQGMEHFIKDMDRSTNRIAFAIVIGAIVLSSAIMHAAGVGFIVYGLSVLGIFTFGVAFLLGIWLIISIIRSGRL